MAIFISAGHNPHGIKRDVGAVANGYHEADLNVEIRNLVVSELKKYPSQKIITDKDSERLGDYLRRIKTGSGSVVLEFHFDAASPSATGTTALVGNDADRLDKAFASELANATSKVLGVKNRGVKSERDTHRGRLGLMREHGTVALLEVCFITNKTDLKRYQAKKHQLAKSLAKIIYKYENLAV